MGSLGVRMLDAKKTGTAVLNVESKLVGSTLGGAALVGSAFVRPVRVA
jgi:hypothetical protein